jgi:hypothetical protein
MQILVAGAKNMNYERNPAFTHSGRTELRWQKNAASFCNKRTPHENPARKFAVFGRAGSTLIRVPVRIDRRKVSPLFREIFQSEDRRHRANRDAGSAVNTFHGANVELRLGLKFRFILTRMNAIDWTDVDACGVFRSDTGLSDYVRHRDSPSGNIYRLKSIMPFNICLESIGLYHQTGNCTSQFLPEKSIARIGGMQ